MRGTGDAGQVIPGAQPSIPTQCVSAAYPLRELLKEITGSAALWHCRGRPTLRETTAGEEASVHGQNGSCVTEKVIGLIGRVAGELGEFVDLLNKCVDRGLAIERRPPPLCRKVAPL
jgi:hypothetical protein